MNINYHHYCLVTKYYRPCEAYLNITIKVHNQLLEHTMGVHAHSKSLLHNGIVQCIQTGLI